MKDCGNCGAPLKSSTCEYCDSRAESPQRIIRRPRIVRTPARSTPQPEGILSGSWKLIALFLLIFGTPFALFHMFTVTVPHGHVGILTKKPGQMELLREGRHAINWFESESVDVVKMVEIPRGFVGVLVDKPVKRNEAGGYQGVHDETLMPGRHQVNTHLYKVVKVDTRPVSWSFRADITEHLSNSAVKATKGELKAEKDGEA